MAIDRRTALGLLGLGVVSSRLEAAHEHAAALKTNPEKYTLQFFSARENAVIDRLAEMIIPADENSPGAHEARASYYIDLIAANSAAAAQANWKSRLEAFDTSLGKPFLDLTEAEQVKLVDTTAAAERKPAAPAERFFADVKRATLYAYYNSPVGLLKELRYDGNKALAAFPGCSHGGAAHHR